MKGNRDVNQQMMAATGESTIGLDLGDRWSRYCVIDSGGTVVKEDRVRTSPEALETAFHVIQPSKIVIKILSPRPKLRKQITCILSRSSGTESLNTWVQDGHFR